MTLSKYLESLTDDERAFISNLDYGNDFEEHRKQLDIVIDKGGDVSVSDQYWCPYEVIELGKIGYKRGMKESLWLAQE